MSLGVILLIGVSSPAFAAVGYANDGLAFSLFLIGFLLLVAAVLKGIDYISKNGKTIVFHVKAFIKKKVTFRPRYHSIPKLSNPPFPQ